MFDFIRRMTRNRLRLSSTEFRMLLFASILFMAGAMAYVWPNVRMVKLSYEYQALQQAHRGLERENRLLQVEKNSLRSLYRIEILAREDLGLRQPGENQVVTIFLK